MNYYHHVSFEEVVQSGKITRDLLEKALHDGRLHLIKEEATGKEWLDGFELHQHFGTDHFSHRD